jgi:hypothetical protein
VNSGAYPPFSAWTAGSALRLMPGGCMTFNDYIGLNLPGAVQTQLRRYARNTPGVESFYDPATRWFYAGTVRGQILTLLSEFAQSAGLTNWLIMADQPYPLSVQKRYADVLIADPANQTHFIMMEVTASMDLIDAISGADKLAGYMEDNADLSVDAYVFFLAVDDQMLNSAIQAVNGFVQANYSVSVTPVGTTP